MTTEVSFEKLITRETVLKAWRQFVRGKWRARAVREYWLRLEYNLTELLNDLISSRYRHGPYYHFVVRDPKRRDVFVPMVRDRVVHQLLSNYLEHIYTPILYQHSYAAQKEKGVHAARVYALSTIQRLYGHGDIWIGKLDVRKYFANINQQLLLACLRRRIHDEKIIHMFQEILASFGDGTGVPLGNLTSQWFGNIYLHELDHYIKHTLNIRYYLRYNDDLIIFGQRKNVVQDWIQAIQKFVAAELCLSIPEEKTSLVRLPGSIDILGLVTNGSQRWIRPATVKRAHRTIAASVKNGNPVLYDQLCSYAGMGIGGLWIGDEGIFRNFQTKLFYP